MIIDCHAHLDERLLTIDNLVRKMDEQGIERVALISRMTETVEPAKSEFLLGVQRNMMNSSLLRPAAAAVSQTFYDSRGDLRPIWKPFTAGKAGFTKSFRTYNEEVADALKKHPDRFWGWICINPKSQPDTLAELERWRGLKGMIGVKVHPYWHQFPVTDLEPVARRSEELGLPWVIHMGFGEQAGFRWLLEKFPRLKINFAHAALPYYKAAWPFIMKSPNAFVDLSSPHLSEAFSRKVVRILGPAKCLYGTDSPYGFVGPDGTYNYGEVKGWIERLPVSDAEREQIFSGNFLRMINP